MVEFFGFLVGTALPRSLREVGDGRMGKILKKREKELRSPPPLCSYIIAKI